MEPIDSLQMVIDSLNTTIELLTTESETNRINILRTIGSSGIIILLFLIERLVTFFSGRNLRKRKFLQEIIVKPSIKEVRNFFKEFYSQLTESITFIRAFEGNGDQIDYQKNVKLNELKAKKIDFDHEFISLVRSVNSKKATDLTEVLNKVEDKATNCITANNLADLNLTEIEKDIHSLKADFFKVIYSI